MLLFCDFRWLSVMSCFLMFLSGIKKRCRFLKAKEHEVDMLILGSLNVAISLVLDMFSEFHMFSQVRVLQISLNISMEKTCASVEPQSSKHRKY